MTRLGRLVAYRGGLVQIMIAAVASLRGADYRRHISEDISDLFGLHFSRWAWH